MFSLTDMEQEFKKSLIFHSIITNVTKNKVENKDFSPKLKKITMSNTCHTERDNQLIDSSCLSWTAEATRQTGSRDSSELEGQ